jgi:hypothetical protein
MGLFRDLIDEVVDTAKKKGSEAAQDLIRKFLPQPKVRSITMPRTPRDLGPVAPRPAFSSGGRRAPEPQFKVRDLPPRYQVRPNVVPAPEPQFRVPDPIGDLGIPSPERALQSAQMAVERAKRARMEPFTTGRQYTLRTPPAGGRPTSIYGPGGSKAVGRRQLKNVEEGLNTLLRNPPTPRPPTGQLELDLGRANSGRIDPGTVQSVRDLARFAKEGGDPRPLGDLVEGFLGPQGSRLQVYEFDKPSFRAPGIPRAVSSPTQSPRSNKALQQLYVDSAAFGVSKGLSSLLGRNDLSSVEYEDGGRGLPKEVIRESFLVQPTPSRAVAGTVVGGVPGQRPPSRITSSPDDGSYRQAVQNAMADVSRSMPGTTGAISPTVSQQSTENVNVPVITTPMGTNNRNNEIGNSVEAAAVAVDNADPAILEATKPRMAIGLARTPLQAVTQSRNALGSRVMDIRDLY